MPLERNDSKSNYEAEKRKCVSYSCLGRGKKKKGNMRKSVLFSLQGLKGARRVCLTIYIPLEDKAVYLAE